MTNMLIPTDSSLEAGERMSSFVYASIKIVYEHKTVDIQGKPRSAFSVLFITSENILPDENLVWLPKEHRLPRSGDLAPAFEMFEQMADNEYIWRIIIPNIQNEWLPSWLRSKGYSKVKAVETEWPIFYKDIRGTVDVDL